MGCWPVALFYHYHGTTWYCLLDSGRSTDISWEAAWPAAAMVIGDKTAGTVIASRFGTQFTQSILFSRCRQMCVITEARSVVAVICDMWYESSTRIYDISLALFVLHDMEREEHMLQHACCMVLTTLAAACWKTKSRVMIDAAQMGPCRLPARSISRFITSRLMHARGGACREGEALTTRIISRVRRSNRTSQFEPDQLD
jgi:hypothetical protein